MIAIYIERETRARERGEEEGEVGGDVMIGREWNDCDEGRGRSRRGRRVITGRRV